VNIRYRKIEKKDRRGVADICYKTGYMGESLEGRGIFDDRTLFGLIFCIYYQIFEPDNSFVAVDEKDRLVGYIMGSLDTVSQKKGFDRHMRWRIFCRLAGVTWWRHPGSAKELLRWLKVPELPTPEGLYDDYPAHLHMNLLPEFQGMGIGGKLMRNFLRHVKASRVKGVHLRTSNHNVKALPFYEKEGFVCVSDRLFQFWSDVQNHRVVIFAMKCNDSLTETGEEEKP